MTATLIRFQQDQSGNVRFHLERPLKWDKALEQHDFKSDATKSPFADLAAKPLQQGAVEQVGAELFKALRSHPAVLQQLDATLNDGQLAGVVTIGLQVESDRADSFPWEALFGGNEFLALDRRRPVVRVVGPKVIDLNKLYIFQPPLRMAIVLGASGSQSGSQISSRDEWDSIARSLASVKPPLLLPMDVLVFAAETDLEVDIKKFGPPVRTEIIKNQTQLTRLLREFRPNILHFFCHGASTDRPHLRISSAADWDSAQDGSIILEAETLRADVDPKQETWLVALNCCESAGNGAAQSLEVRNLSATLIRKGFPAVLGMRDRVDASHARLLTEQFYQDAFEYFGNLTEDNQFHDIEWGSLLVSGRKRISDFCAPAPKPNSAADNKEWTIPALYIRTDSFQVKRMDPKPTLTDEQRAGIRAEIQQLRGQMDTIRSLAVSEESKKGMLAELEAKLETLIKQLN
jgi:hypothetical protein